MLKKIGKFTLIVTTSALLAACATRGSQDMSNSPNNTMGNAQGNLGHNDGMSHHITPGSLEDYRKNIGDRVFFDTAEYLLSSEAKNTLNQQAGWLRKYASGRTIVIEGHADERGTREYNIALGARRANSVRNYLVSQGLPMTAFNVVSYGKERPAVDGSDAYAWAKNRRVVIMPK